MFGFEFIRRIHLKKIVVFSFILALCLNVNTEKCFATNKEKENVELSITSKSAILIELNSGKVLYEKNEEEMLRPASVTKIMTLLLIFEEMEKGKLNYDDVVTVSEHAASMGGSQCFFEAGETQSVKDMIKCIEVASGNDAAVAMAEHIAGSEEAFVGMMNKRANELGMNHTHFENACGLESENHLTCAKDIAIMSRQLMKYHPEITEFSTIWMDSIIHKTRRGESKFDLANTNKFLNMYTGANGLKTGYTSQAKYCMSASANRGDICLIAVIMGADTKEIRNSEAMKLLDYGFAHCTTYVDTEVVPKDIKIAVKNGTKNNVSVKPIDKHSITLIDMDEKLLKKEVVSYKNVKAPIKEGDAVGVIQYMYQDEMLDEVLIYAAFDIPEKNMKNSAKKVAERLFMVK